MRSNPGGGIAPGASQQTPRQAGTILRSPLCMARSASMWRVRRQGKRQRLHQLCPRWDKNTTKTDPAITQHGVRIPECHASTCTTSLADD
eukprot:10162472-Alexandrium_andersonii.AAC.1